MSSLGFYIAIPKYRSLLSARKCAVIKSLIDFCCTLGSHICLLFQACTGIDNIAEAITLLELNNWDLVVSFTHTDCNTLGFKAVSVASTIYRIISAREMLTSLLRECVITGPVHVWCDIRLGWLDHKWTALSTAVNKLKCVLWANYLHHLVEVVWDACGRTTFVVWMLMHLIHLQHREIQWPLLLGLRFLCEIEFPLPHPCCWCM